MSDDEDNYLSDKFLLGDTVSTPSKPQTYAERRKQSQRQSELRNLQNKKKSRKQLEEEARQEGLKSSLFERARADEEQYGKQNKALSMMMKMGFKPGQSLGRTEDAEPTTQEDTPATVTTNEQKQEENNASGSHSSHRVQPLPIDMWAGKKGVGLGKRTVSPSAVEKLAKLAKLDDDAKQDYRTRTREAYEEKRAGGRLLSATRTLSSLDEQAGVEFNILSLNPHDVESFPSGLLDAISDSMTQDSSDSALLDSSQNDRLKEQMCRDALQPLGSLGTEDDITSSRNSLKESFDTSVVTPEIVEASKDFLRLNARDRLDRVLAYLREKHYYCFWCGTKYQNSDDMSSNCPGKEEDEHD